MAECFIRLFGRFAKALPASDPAPAPAPAPVYASDRPTIMYGLERGLGQAVSARPRIRITVHVPENLADANRGRIYQELSEFLNTKITDEKDSFQKENPCMSFTETDGILIKTGSSDQLGIKLNRPKVPQRDPYDVIPLCVKEFAISRGYAFLNQEAANNDQCVPEKHQPQTDEHVPRHAFYLD
jgi:hypothetical protein